jgi:hypothetical protein
MLAIVFAEVLNLAWMIWLVVTASRRRQSRRRSRVALDARGLAQARCQECRRTTLNTGIFIFDGVEVLDFAGPFEVFSRTRLLPGVESERSDVSAPFNVFKLARSADTVHATGGLRVLQEGT